MALTHPLPQKTLWKGTVKDCARAVKAPGSGVHFPVLGDQTSPFLPPRGPLQEPSMVKTRASEVIAEDCGGANPRILRRVVDAGPRVVVATCKK